MTTKKESKYFTIFNHEKEEEYLRNQHKAGWKFIKVTGFGKYHFEKCQPEDVVYQLDFNQEGSANKDEYIKMFSDCGWEYIQEYVGYSYFRKKAADMNGEETIFSDDSSRIAMMERVYKMRLLPLLVLFVACILPQFIIQLGNGRYGLAVFFGIILAIYVAVFGGCAWKYYTLKRK